MDHDIMRIVEEDDEGVVITDWINTWTDNCQVSKCKNCGVEVHDVEEMMSHRCEVSSKNPSPN